MNYILEFKDPTHTSRWIFKGYSDSAPALLDLAREAVCEHGEECVRLLDRETSTIHRFNQGAGFDKSWRFILGKITTKKKKAKAYQPLTPQLRNQNAW